MRRPSTILAVSVVLFVAFVGASLTAHAQSTYRLVELPRPQGVTNFISVSDINDRGEAAGYSQTFGTVHTFRGLYWDVNGSVSEVGDLPGGSGNSICSGINNQGVLSGRGKTGAEFHAFIWDSTTGNFTDLGTLPNASGPFSYAVQINRHNQVVGYSSIGGSQYHPFLW